MKRVLLTGARGFVGSHCLPGLLRRGFEVHAVSSQNVGPVGGPCGVVWHQADLLDPAQCRRVVCSVRPTHLLHLAWETEPGKFWSSPANLDWLAASVCLLRQFVDHGGRRAVLAGSCAEYDWSFGGCDEFATPLRPTSLYGTCKMVLHEVLAAFGAESGISPAWARLFFLYGPGAPATKFPGAVIDALLAGRRAPCSEGSQCRDFMHAADAGDALAAIADCDACGPINVASGRPVAIRRIAETVARLLGRPDLLAPGAVASRPDEPESFWANVERLHHEVGWRPAYDLKRGLEQTIQWCRRGSYRAAS